MKPTRSCRTDLPRYAPAAALAGLLICSAALAAPTVEKTTVIGPFVGHDARLHTDNEHPRIHYYGTDLGWSYEFQGRLEFLFGDTMADPRGATIGPTHDDSFGSIDLSKWPDPQSITPGNIPPVLLGQDAGTAHASGIDPGQPMESFKTPVAGFSNGSREFAIFVTGKPRGCQVDNDCDNGLQCDATVGYLGVRPDVLPGLTLPCADGAPGCSADTVLNPDGKPAAHSGLCVDRGSSIRANTAFGRAQSYGMRQIVALRSTTDPREYSEIRGWWTNRFLNVAARTVADFTPGRSSHDYSNHPGTGGNQRVFLWGRPGFVGVNASGSTLSLYFAYADMPAAPDFSWDLHYFTGTDANGQPLFSSRERDAAPLDLNSGTAGIQSAETYDVVDQMSIVWVPQLDQWVMFYGGGFSKFPIPGIAPHCGVLEIFVHDECDNVVLGNNAFRMRTADNPWGPWSPPQDLFVGGDPNQVPPVDQYAPGGVMYHPACQGDGCATRTAERLEGDYGFLYSPNIIEPWIRAADDGVDVIWNASTWDPYRVVLLRTRIRK